MQHNAITLHVLGTRLDNLGQRGIKRVSKADMTYDTPLEKGKRPDTLSAVDNLIGDDEVHGLDLLLQRTDGGEGNDAADTDTPQSSNIGAVGDLVRCELVVEAMAGEERDVGAVVGEDVDGRRGRAPGRYWVEYGNGFVAIELGESGAADDTDEDGF